MQPWFDKIKKKYHKMSYLVNSSVSAQNDSERVI